MWEYKLSTTQSEQAFYQNATSNPLLVKKLVRKEINKDIYSMNRVGLHKEI